MMRTTRHDTVQSKCCPVCNCLGYCAEQNQNDRVPRSRPKVLTSRTFRDFEASAKDGCRYCDYAFQGFVLLGSTAENPEVELILYVDSPTELHSATNENFCDVVEIYPSSDTESPFPKVANDVPRDDIRKTSLEFIQENYDCCCNFHPTCAEDASSLPKRVVDISKERYRLIEPENGTNAAYATLSYSWGGKNFMTTTSGSYERLKDGFEKDEMPLAFQEAAVIAQYLDIDYIWIDSLCIVQDNEDDWESQAAHMGQIFESAAVTIAASLSHNPHESLFVRKNPRYEEFELYNDSHGNHNGAVFKARRKTTFGIHAKTGRSKDVDHLDTRAWGLQEKLLSRRLIAFTGAEIQWTCRTSKVCECRSKTYTPEPLLLPSAKEADIKNEHGYTKAWSRIVEPYSDRSLTFPDDRLPAISGLAKKFQQTTDFTYIAGLWKENICYDLMWQCDIMTSALISTPMVDPAASYVTSTRAYLAPSFSWVSARGAVNYRLARHSYPGTRIQHMSLVNYRCSTIGLNPFGKVTDGSLDVRGTTIEAWLQSSSGTPDDYELCIMDTIYQPNADQRKACEFSIDLQHTAGIWANTGEQPAQALGSKRLRIGIGDIETPVVLLGVYSIHHRNYLYQNFLILRSSPRAINTYERLGIGSGKIYNRDEIPAQSQLVQPFEWLSVDLGERAHALKTVVDQVIRIT